MTYPDIEVTEATANLLDLLADQCLSLLVAWSPVYVQLGKPVDSGSVAAQEMAAFRGAHPDAPQGIELLPGQLAGLYLAGIGQHLQGVASLLLTQHGLLSLWPLVRAELELAGRINWFLMLGSAEEPPGTDTRVARASMEKLAAHCRDRYTASRLRNKADEKLAKEGRDKFRTVVEATFSCSHTDWNAPGEEANWIVSSDRFVGLTQASTSFVKEHLKGTGVYDQLSDFSHPSAVALARQTAWEEIAGVAHLNFKFDPEVILWQAQAAALVFLKAGRIISAYYRLDETALDEWEQNAPEDWFKEEPGDG